MRPREVLKILVWWYMKLLEEIPWISMVMAAGVGMAGRETQWMLWTGVVTSMTCVITNSSPASVHLRQPCILCHIQLKEGGLWSVNGLPRIGTRASVVIWCANVMPQRPDASQGVFIIRSIKITSRRNARKKKLCTVGRKTIHCSMIDRKIEQRDCSIAFCFSSLYLNHDHTVLELICSLISPLARFVNLRICFGDHVSAMDLSNLA